eukprot:scaffold69705_cov47-Attheya_sp.AAC.1
MTSLSNILCAFLSSARPSRSATSSLGYYCVVSSCPRTSNLLRIAGPCGMAAISELGLCESAVLNPNLAHDVPVGPREQRIWRTPGKKSHELFQILCGLHTYSKRDTCCCGTRARITAK